MIVLNTVGDLGVQLYSNLTFTLHINEIVAKVQSKLTIISTSKGSL